MWEVLTPINATHSGIRTSLHSTSPYDLASQLYENAPLRRDKVTLAASVVCLSPVTLSAQHYSTSELLRTL